jgi:ABC-type glycerol-3-phosphate transport system permease component
VAEYLLIRELGLIDKPISAILLSSISVVGALVLHMFYRQYSRSEFSFGCYIKTAAPFIAIVFAIGFIIAWGSSDAMTILQTTSKFPVTLLIRELFVQNDASRIFTDSFSDEKIQTAKHIVGIAASLPPLIVGWAVIWLNKLFFSKKTVAGEKDTKEEIVS